MKKYISILSLITVLLMQSCERSDSDLNNMTEQNELNIEVPKHKESARIENKVPEENNSENLDTGDDDDPPRDKQHWRIEQDTIGKALHV